MQFRLAKKEDIPAISAIFEEIHKEEEKNPTVGWIRGVYPTAATAEKALERGDLFVQEAEGKMVGTAIINQIQVDVYAHAPWEHSAPDEQVMVLHTLCISPAAARRGYGRAFVQFYEEYARQKGCPYLRIDTNAKNAPARGMYQKLGYKEIAVVPCDFNGIEGVRLVLLEKYLG